MKELKKHQFLLSVVALLIIIKWLYVPIVDWQDERYFEIKQMLSKLGLSLTRTVWENALESVEPQIKQYKMKVFFKGRTNDMVRYVTELEKHKPYIEVNDFIFNINKRNKEPFGSVSGNLTLSLYMKMSAKG